MESGERDICLGLGTARWFSKALKDCLKAGRKEFYSAHREGVRGYNALRRSNSRGCFMALVEYGEGGNWSFIFIQEDRDGRGWRKLSEALWEASSGGDFALLPSQMTSIAQQQPLS